MTKHPTKDWEFDDAIEEAFQEWFNDLYGGYSLRSEWFYGDAEVEDVKLRQDLMYKWLHSAYVAGYECAMYAKLEKTYDEIDQRIEETDELLKEVDEYLEK